MNSHRSVSTLIALAILVLPGGVGFAAANRAPGDAPLKIHQPYAANFPNPLLAEGVTSGQVRAVIVVEADGRLTDHLILGYTHPELVRELVESLGEWEFEAARERGEPVGTRAEIIFNFEARGVVLTLTPANTPNSLYRWAPQKVVTQLCLPADLDRPLVAIRTAPPVHPGPQLRPAQPEGTALIDFYVDAEGRPRMPVAVSATHPAFAAAAIDALAQWGFSPPQRQGKPVVVHLRQKFVFNSRS